MSGCFRQQQWFVAEDQGLYSRRWIEWTPSSAYVLEIDSIRTRVSLAGSTLCAWPWWGKICSRGRAKTVDEAAAS